ncbi:hypothetical protein [Acetobacter tropicalis]|uniref:CdiA toxin EC869-like domain-containing protein n=2 Tax=Acetobacter TaxID=434 RepID=A0A291PEK2_9PROT|nr:hypothetical protein CIW82_02860 [Acetobacter tropicalis]
MPTAENLYSCSFGNCQTTYWGQLPPDTAALQTAGTALYNLSYAWTTTIQNQTTDQLAAEAAAYQPIAGTDSYGQIIENISLSINQAKAVLASALTDPMMNDAGTADQFRQVISNGDTGLVEAVADQENVQNNIHDVIQEGDKDPCDVPTFKGIHSEDVQNSDIAAANNVDGRQMAGRPTIQWKDGVQWVSKGNGIQVQGNPFEVWDAQRLKDQGYDWLADYQTPKSNWKTFDEWQASSGTAVSDKTIDMGAKSYQVMRNIQGRLLANVQDMIRYESDLGPYRYNDGSDKVGTSLQVTQTQIKHFSLDLGVPVETTNEQWEAICKALQRAKERVAEDSRTSTKDIDFAVKIIT